MSEKKELYKGAAGLRWSAVILWILAIASEIVAIFLLTTTNDAWIYGLPFSNGGDSNALMYWVIGILVLDAIFCIIAALLWKKANRIKPSKSKSKIVKLIWDQLGVIMCLIAFIPVGILLLKSTDKFDPKTKKILLAVVALLLLGSVSASIDYNPVSPGDEQNLEALIESQYGEEDITRDENGNIIVWWTQYGKSMHLDENCYYIADSTTKKSGTIAEAIEAGKKDPCDNCLELIKDVNKEDIEAMAAVDEADLIPEDTTEGETTEETP